MPARLLAPLLALALLVPPGAACAEEAGQPGETMPGETMPGETMDVSGPLLSFHCESGAEVQLAELTLETGEVLILLFLDGEEIQMRAEAVASGAKYRSLDPELALVWHGEGAGGLLYREEADGEIETLERGCRQL
ncbi:MAG: MliC family protein [Parvibaculum sp.]|uniref:MliC family protein n=1 Tax=Parvibaculum sp. TaxID=2024848 RepID=UPI0034A02B95